MSRPRRRRLARLLPLLATACLSGPARNDERGIAWREFTPQLFEAAQASGKLVLLDLGTGWCHWCHVMEETTYRDAAVTELLREHYLVAKADADARIDLASRYEEYGWPATIVFDAHGTELVKLRGYVEPRRLAALLQACVDDPTPGPSVRAEAKVDFSTTATLPDELRRELREAHERSYDADQAGFVGALKYLPEWSVEYDLELARRGDRNAEERARATLAANLALLDPAWGGVWQYSHGGDWSHPHFEKIMSFQALDLRLYAQAFALWGDPAHRNAAQEVHRYLVAFLRAPDGAFFASQDADLVDGEHGGDYFALDDAGRRALGIPRVDRNVRARENGWAIEALAVLFEATGDASARDEAEAAARVMLATRRAEGGAFRHGESDAQPEYLGDTLAMGQALLELHVASGSASGSATGRREWLDAAIAAADSIERLFGAPDPAAARGAGATAAGYPTALPLPDATGALPQPQRDENLALARFTNRLDRLTGEARFARMRERAMRYLVTPAIAQRPPAAAVLLVADEVDRDPIHVTIVAPHADAAGRRLFERALRIPTRHKLVEWWSPQEDPPLPGGAAYPASDHATAFVCADGRCSAPLADLVALEKALAAASK